MLNRISKVLLISIILTAVSVIATAEALDISMLDDIEEAQMVAEGDTWTYPIPYHLLMTSDYIQLVNRENLLEEDDIPDDLLKDLDCRKVSYDPIQMRETAANALYTLFDAAEEDGIYLYAHSGYRSYRTQKTMYYRRLESRGYDDGIVQYPGASEHQSGLAIDVINKAGIGKNFTNDAFSNSKEGKWLAENCWDYGFIIRYQEDKEDITGIGYESWHIRYVGVQVAQYMRDQHLSLEEFTEEWKAAAAAFEGV